MDTAISEERQALYTQIAQAEDKIKALRKELHVVDGELEGMSREREKYELLGNVCDSLIRLKELEADDLFWGAEAEEEREERVRRVRGVVVDFREKLSSVEQRRRGLEEGVSFEAEKIAWLNEELERRIEQEERRKHEFVIEREPTQLPYRPLVMPWASRGEDERRLRLILLVTLLFTGGLGYLVATWVLPPVEVEVIEVPERIAKLVKKLPPPPPPKPKPKEEKKPEEKKPEEKKPEQTEKRPRKDVPKPTTKEQQVARAKAERSGVLAFSNSFSDLIDDNPDQKIGANASLNNKGQKSSRPTRSIIASNAVSSSGGINTASISRNAGGGSGRAITGSNVAFTRVGSGIAEAAGSARPVGDGAGPSRTDEEIQIVFDRYKGAVYRIYQRELRRDPTLQGRMVLRLTIEPDGSVSACSVESSELNSPALSANVVARVKKFNFGPKEGVPAVTIKYPIDFLPAG